MSVLSKDPAPKPERMNMRIHQLSNVAQALSFLEGQVGHESMPDIGNEAIVNGDAKKTLALIFFIMLKYQIQLIVSEHGDDFLHSLSELSRSENGVTTEFNMEHHQPQQTQQLQKPISSSRKFASLNSISDKLQHNTSSAEAKVALLYWVRIQLEDYISANIIPSIQDFSRSWRNGVAFCLLIHRYNPTYIPDLFSVYLNNSDLSEKSTWLHLLRLAFQIATEQMGVQAYLEPEDLIDVDYPHEPSVMMYVSEYYKVISKYQREEPLNIKRERAVKRKAEILIASGGDPIPEEDEEEVVRAESPTTLEIMATSHNATLPNKTGQFLQPPTPIPMPSARRKKKMAQRESTLGEEDKARIKADLNSKLLMQLTGHLPRGVHPTLDELLTIHETVLSFIKSNTRTIDEIPEEFINSTSVSEYIDALEIIEEQVDSEVEHLDTAKNAKDILTSPPETADDTLIRLTDLQRSQVSKVYDMLKKEWDQFVDLLKTTKDDLLTVENALIDTEEGAQEYIQRADEIEKELDMYTRLLDQAAPIAEVHMDTETENEANVVVVTKNLKIHPIEGSLEHAVQYKAKLAEFVEQFTSFQNTSWKKFRKSSKALSRAVMQVVSARSSQVTSKYDTLVLNLNDENKNCVNFERGLTFLEKVQEIENELNLIQLMMEENGQQETTDDDIQQLETKVAAVRITIYNTKETYEDLLRIDVQYSQLLAKIQSRYEIVNKWVDQVRVWFVEADRIRSWIEIRIQNIHDSNQKEIDPLSEDISHLKEVATPTLYDDHSKLKREIERFDEDDMTRLRSHVMALTHDSERNISPADASTIEITLTTLNILNKLKSLLQKRSRLIDTLRVRITWEEILEKVIAWCEKKDKEIHHFLYGKARWSASEEDEISAHQLKMLTEEVIQTLVALENSVAEFDKGDYTVLLDKYQEMEELGDSELPFHLERRQEDIEKDFEKLMKRNSFTRKVVEQHLLINDVNSQFRKLRSEGEKIKSSMNQSADTSSNNQQESNVFGERIQAFKDNSSHWVTTLVKRIPYPETSTDQDGENNQKANHFITDRMNEYATLLAELTEDLEVLLSSHRDNLSLRERTSLAYDDILRIASWIEERLRTLQSFDSSVLDNADVISLSDETIVRLEKEHEGIAARLDQLQKGDIERSLNHVRQLEVEIDETNSVSIDRVTLVNGIERLEQSHEELKKALVLRTFELAILKKRIAWESQWDDAEVAILDLAQNLWDFNERFAQFDTEELKKKRSSSTSVDSIEANKEAIFTEISNRFEHLTKNFQILSSEDAYLELQGVYLSYNKEMEEGEQSLPECIILKQNELKKKFADLKLLSKYVQDVLEQQSDISELVALSLQVFKEGELAQETFQNALRETSTSSTSDDSNTEETNPLTSTISLELIEQIEAIIDQIDVLCKTGQSVGYISGENWFESAQPQSMTSPNDYNMQLRAFVEKRSESLVKLKGSLNRILNSYRHTTSINSKLKECRVEANSISEWIDHAVVELNAHQVDVTTATINFTERIISRHHDVNVKTVAELHTLEHTRITPLKKNIDEILQYVRESNPTILQETTDSCDLLLESIERNLEMLRHAISNHNLIIDTARKRLSWENDLEDAQSRLDFINHQLQQYILKKNKCVAQQDVLFRNEIAVLEEERSDIEDQYKRFANDRMKSVEFQYEQVRLLFVRLPLTKSIPMHLQERMESCTRDLQKLADALIWREKELDYLKQRSKLELDLKQTMADLDQHKKSISVFLEENGRWKPNDSNDLDVDEELLSLKECFETFQKSTAMDITERYKTLDSISASLKPGFLSEIHSKKIGAMIHGVENVEADLSFALQVVSQRKQIWEFLDQASELEKVAESIKDEFFSLSSVNNGMAEQNKHLESFSSRVEEVRQFAKVDIITPKRLNEEDTPMPIKIKDKTMNSVIQDLISTRIGRLDELVENLSSLSRSQEVFTRLQYVLQMFRKQLTICGNWISSRRDILERSVHILDDNNLSLDLNHLRDAVSEADSIQTAMTAHDNNYTLLCKHRDNYIKTFDEQSLLSEEEKKDAMNEFDQFSEEFENISREWQDLVLETKEVSNALSAALLPAELNNRITDLMVSFSSLQSQINDEDELCVTDTQISEWQKRIDHLEYKEYDRLHSEITEYKKSISADMIDSLMRKLDNAGDTILEIRATLTSFYDLINASRLRNTHTENSKLLFDSAEKLATLVEELQKGKFSITTDKLTGDERVAQFKNLTAAHKQIKEVILECHGFYDDSCSYYSAIKVQDAITPDSEKVQMHVQDAWELVQDKNRCLSAFITRTSKWIEGCDALDKLKQSLDGLNTKVNGFITIPLASNTNTKIQKYEKKLSHITLSIEELENTIKNSPDMDSDMTNKSRFMDRCQANRKFGLEIQKMLEIRRMDKERTALFAIFKGEIAKVSKVCEDQISYIRQQTNVSPENHLKRTESINNIINAYSAALSHITDNYTECKNKFDGIISDQATKLIKTFDHPFSEVEGLKFALEKLLQELQDALKKENEYITLLKLLNRLTKSEKDISKNILELKSNNIRPHTSRSSKTNRTRELPELKEYVQRFDSIEVSIKEFQKKCDEIQKNLNQSIGAARTTAITKFVDRRRDEMIRKWNDIKSSAEETRERLDILNKRQKTLSKLSESLKYVSNLKDRVEVLQLSGYSVVIEEHELNELQEEIDVTLKQYTEDIDGLLNQLSKSEVSSTASLSEGSLKSQREKLNKSIDELSQLVQHRKKQAHTEGSISEFFGLVDQIDSEIHSLSEVTEKTSTQHASIVGSKFNKTDLQQLLKTLTNAFKKTEPKVSQLLTKAKLEAQKQFLDDNERVAKRLKKSIKDWSTIKASVSSREKELQTCIKELNHEFFTKLAMAKSAPRERRARRSSKSRTDSGAASGPRQSTFRSSTLSTEMKMTSPPVIRKSKTPADSSSGSKTSTYVADPKNELDVQLSLIVNDSPFRMKVKKVPGEVGKYWFGDEHPRLVYCRILPSKMVMVRVGGGWVELSKFMKDHGHSDNLATKSENGETRYLTVSTFNDEDTPSFSVTTRSGSPLGPIIGTPIIRRGSGVSSSLTNRSSNSSSGYVEGDKFIQTDEEGNQVSHKMVKADLEKTTLNSNNKLHTKA
ncbi:unnamed protein product [Mucor hiemalis]